MNHLTRIYTTAGQLQASRSFLKDLRGLGKTPEGVEFAKAISEGAAEGITPMEVVEQVVKAMGGDQGKALEILGAVEEITKGMVGQHTRTLSNGKTVNVKAYENARTAAMKQTTLAHGATFHAMRTKTPEGHENAAASHEEAAKQHGEAHSVHPMDVPEVGEEHAKLKASHLNAVAYHRSEAGALRGEEKYNRAKTKAETATRSAGEAYDSHTKVAAHQAAAAAHTKAAEAKPNAGHEERAEGHEIQAQAHEASFKAGMGPLPYPTVKRAAMASGEAEKATTQAVKTGTKGDHGKAAALHAQAIDHHMGLHGQHESSEDGHHGQMAMRHMELHSYHAKKAQEAEGATAKVEKVAKAEGCMTTLGGGTDIATKTGGAALAVEGRPDEKDRKKDEDDEEVGKAIFHGYTRVVNGKEVQVKPYETATRAREMVGPTHKHALTLTSEPQLKALKASQATQYAHEQSEWFERGHDNAAFAHRNAADAHRAVGTEKNNGFADKHEALAKEHDLHHAAPVPIAKSHVEGHTRTVGGKVVQVKAYDFERMWNHHGEVMNNASHHPRAASATDDAVLASEEAHGNEELGVEKNDQHAYAAHMHRSAADAHDHASSQATDPALKLHHATSAMQHRGFADEHSRVQHTLSAPDAGDHSTEAMEKLAGMNLHGNGTARQATEHAHEMTTRAGHKDTALAHGKAYNAHRTAAEAHRDRERNHTNRMDTMPEMIEGHRSIAKHHDDAAAAHLEEMRARKDAATPGVEGAPAPRAKSREEKHGHAMADSFVNGLKHLKTPEEKAEAIREEHAEMDHFGSETPEWMTDKNYEPSANAYWDALSAHHKKLVGKPIEVAKAEVAQHTRVVGGKTIQVSGYTTHRNAANAISSNATKATSHAMGKGGQEHRDAAQLHKDAAEAHRNAAEHAPEPWMQRGHEQQAQLHGHYAQSHNEHADKAAREDTLKARQAEANSKSPAEHSKAAWDAAASSYHNNRGEDGYAEGHDKAADMHEKAGDAHLKAHAEGKGKDHFHEASRHFASAAEHVSRVVPPESHAEYAGKIAKKLGEHADAHKLEETHESYGQHAEKHLLAIEAHARARDAYGRAQSDQLIQGDEEGQAESREKMDEHQAHVERHRGKMAEGHNEIETRQKRAYAATRATAAPTLGVQNNRDAAAAHRAAAKIQYDSDIRASHENSAAQHDARANEQEARPSSVAPAAKPARPASPERITTMAGQRAESSSRIASTHAQKATSDPSVETMRKAADKHDVAARHHKAAAAEARGTRDASGKQVPGAEETAKHHEKQAQKHTDASFGHRVLAQGMERTPQAPPETHHDKALAAASSVRGRSGKQMLQYTKDAHAASVRAEQTGKKDDHAQAARLHMGAEMSHDQANEDTDYKHEGHQKAWEAHHAAVAYHRAKAQ